jgi:IS30 family transposase
MDLEMETDAYSCNPQSPWQRGSNANTNRLVRRYIPKGTDLSVHSRAYLNKVARQLNEAARRQERFRLGCTGRVRHAFPCLG